MGLLRWFAAGAALFSTPALAVFQSIDITDREAVKMAAAEVAEDLLGFYRGEEPGWVYGILPGPPPDGDYYWWIGGAMWGTLLDYRKNTGDKTYDGMITRAIVHQVGDKRDFMPANWTASMGNDDQGFWAMTAMLAAETNFPAPDEKFDVDYLSLVQAVFNEQTMMERRVVGGNCDWGLRWQAYSFNNGWDYVNTISNGIYFNLGARLARYTGNDTYAEMATKTYEFLERLGYIDEDGNAHDGAHQTEDCMNVNKQQFSYNAAVLIQGAAHMYDYTKQDPKWKKRLDLLVGRTLSHFFPDGIAYEAACETQKTCNVDMRSFKGYMHRWISSATLLAPHLADQVRPVFETSAEAAVRQCTGGDNQRLCGFYWSTGSFDGLTSAVHQMNVLGALTGLLMDKDAMPLTNTTGGTSRGNPDAGKSLDKLNELPPITQGDRVGAGIVTTLFLGIFASMFAWMSIN